MAAPKNQDFESPLCIPQDKLEDIDFFPNFDDDLIRLSEALIPELDSLTSFDDIIVGRKQEFRDDLYSTRDVESKCFDNNRSKDYSFDERETLSSLDSKHSFDDGEIYNDSIGCSKVLSSIKNKKPRSEKPRKENRNLMLKPQLRTAKRRRCVHCQAEETPQWRMGPTGRNTLCNACGLRYKSGRLVQEYRPAASPSFDGTKHSNFHTRILMQKKPCEDDNPGEVVNG